MRIRLQKSFTYSNVMATVAVFLALGGGAYAAFKLPANSVGKRELKNGAVTARKLARGAVTASNVAPNSLTGRQINAASLGTVPEASHAANSDRLGGSPGAAFQTRVTGSCGANSSIAQINADGGVACGHVQFYSNRIVAPLNSGDTFLTIPGIAHLTVLNCQAGGANAQLLDDAPGTTDLWEAGDTSYLAPWGSSTPTPFAPTGGAVWHLGAGSGPGSKTVTVTVSAHARGTDCIFQGTAEIITS
jgi:hypothetical protein